MMEQREIFGFHLDWGGILCFHEPYPYGAPNSLKPHFDVDFSVTLPWVPGEPE